MQAWVQGGSNLAFYYRFDVAMPGDDAGAFHSSIYGSHSTISEMLASFLRLAL